MEKDKTYLVERKSLAFGGGIKEIKINNITKKYIKVNGTWHHINYINETFNILEELKD